MQSLQNESNESKTFRLFAQWDFGARADILLWFRRLFIVQREPAIEQAPLEAAGLF
jgi:hypothetical protein